MVNEYCRVPQWEATRTLAAVAQGLEKAELVVREIPDGACLQLGQ